MYSMLNGHGSWVDKDRVVSFGNVYAETDLLTSISERDKGNYNNLSTRQAGDERGASLTLNDKSGIVVSSGMASMTSARRRPLMSQKLIRVWGVINVAHALRVFVLRDSKHYF